MWITNRLELAAVTCWSTGQFLEQMPDGARIKTCSAFVVGVTQRDLFWKDIRQVLFSGARYTVFCRLGMSGLADKWHPVKVADVLAGIAPTI